MRGNDYSGFEFAHKMPAGNAPLVLLEVPSLVGPLLKCTQQLI
jgi:hypothetical protein